MIEWVTGLPLWEIIRVSGVVSYALLALGVALGILCSFPFWSGKTKASLYKLHQYATNGGTLIGLLHGLITVIDQYSPFAWREVLIPFAAKQSPILNGLGTLAAYGLMIVILTTDLKGKLGRKAWRLLHMLAYPIFIMAFIHGYFLGTDTGYTGIKLLYTGPILVILSLTAFRIMFRHDSSPNSKIRPVPPIK